MSIEINAEDWSLSPSYDVGVKYTFRNLLKDNPYRQNFFRHWLATLDHENIKNFYNYETGERKKKGDLSATEVHYDQVQKMVYDANLPRAIEDELFYHLDYHLNRENKSIDFLKLKEFFAFCGVEGVYDLEKGRHFLMTKEHPFLLDNLRIDRWTSEDKAKNREIIARMMAKPGEIPFNRDKIADLREQYGLEWLSHFSKTEIHDKFMGRANSIFGSKRTPEEIAQSAEEASKNGIDLDEYDKEIEEYTKQFDQSPEAQVFLSQIKTLEEDEAEKLQAALDKYVPDELLQDDSLFKSFDQNLGKYGLSWDQSMHDWMADADQWAALYLGHEGPETCSKEPPTEEERAVLDPELLEMGEFQHARYEHMMHHFNHEVWPAIRSRYCAFEDWILRDYTMNPINKGELAKARREDIPVLFKESLRNELADGLLQRINFPIRVEKKNDHEYELFYNNISVERFNPQMILAETFEKKAMNEPSIKQRNIEAANLDNSSESALPDGGIDFKIHAPSAEKQTEDEVLDHSLYGDYNPQMDSPSDYQPSPNTYRENQGNSEHRDRPLPHKKNIGPANSPAAQALNGGKQLVNRPNPYGSAPMSGAPLSPGMMGGRGGYRPPQYGFGFPASTGRSAAPAAPVSPIMEHVNNLNKVSSIIQSKNLSGTPLDSDFINKVTKFSDTVRADVDSILSGDSKGVKKSELKQLRKGITSIKDGLLEAKDPEGLLSEVKAKCLESLEKTKESIEKALKAFMKMISSILSRFG